MAIKCNLKQLILNKSAGNSHRITYAEISEATGLSTTTITKLANNQSALVGISTLDRLCAYFGVGVGELLEYVPMPAPVIAPDGHDGHESETEAVA